MVAGYRHPHEGCNHKGDRAVKFRFDDRRRAAKVAVRLDARIGMGFLQGRTNRATYWFSLGIVAVLLAIIALVFRGPAKVSEFVLIMVCVPRLHDIGRSGWIAAAVVLAEIGVAIGGVFVFPVESFFAAMGVVVLLIAGLLIWLGTIPGEPLANRFGEQPAPGIGFRPKARA
jgi:uncharacterized membrane protein YhaH (DUF805 family)